eukprot:CAMPEP_0206374734 /NCGR_PEP_ID=MMETSP0294-20121207/8480_1 /ASSEMBLY_ACC=CAM_ASM_000327 /TAXON_ID=39354 /ORGANISM="Heterosigma akashiwo, Strain CCMP2393" /LENGTH=575 /DNA_ID=CAMNT_0053822559 /DNA_START=409 /DNA_END=2132 /DNA_ORIENTATION=-
MQAHLLRSIQEKGADVQDRLAEGNIILPNLFLGSWNTSRNSLFLKGNGIKRVLTVGPRMPPSFPEEYVYKVLDIRDDPQDDLPFQEAFAYIDAGRREGGVLVHCEGGISRSASICIAYVMKETQVGVKDALSHVRRCRPFVSPNPGFLAQLECLPLQQLQSERVEVKESSSASLLASASEIISEMNITCLSPLLSLLDLLLGHETPLISPPIETGVAADDVASCNLTSLHMVNLNLLKDAATDLTVALGALGLQFSAHNEEDRAQIVLIFLSSGATLTRADVRRLVSAVEERLAAPEVVLRQLKPTAERVTRACLGLVERLCPGAFPMDDLRRCAVQTAAFFDEEWSVGLETAWMASGAEGLLVMPDYERWGARHFEHRLRAYRGVEGAEPCPGRLWRFERWECLRVPCHEVVHLLQHFAGQRMGSQLAEHHGAFATYLLMLAVAKEDGVADLYRPAAAWEGMAESLLYARGVLAGTVDPATAALWAEHAESYAAWRDSFGVAAPSAWGAQRNFGGDLNLERLSKNLLALEAAAPRGRVLAPGSAEAAAAAAAMLATMFEGRAGDLDNVPVAVRP